MIYLYDIIYDIMILLYGHCEWGLFYLLVSVRKCEFHVSCVSFVWEIYDIIYINYDVMYDIYEKNSVKFPTKLIYIYDIIYDIIYDNLWYHIWYRNRFLYMISYMMSYIIYDIIFTNYDIIYDIVTMISYMISK